MKSYFLLFPIFITSFGFFPIPQDNPRRLLLFGKAYAECTTQLSWPAKDAAGLTERNIVIEKFETTDAVVKEYSANPKEFVVLLIGKDGSEKYRNNKPIDIKTLFSLIDSMPMRKDEMKRKSRN